MKRNHWAVWRCKWFSWICNQGGWIPLPASYCHTDLVSVGCCFLESVLELLSALQVVLQSELAAFRQGDKPVPLCLSLHKLRSPAGHQECGLILFWLTPVKMGTCIAKTIGASNGSKESKRLQAGLNRLSEKGLSVLPALQYWFQHLVAGAEVMSVPGGIAVALSEGKVRICPLWNHKNVNCLQKILKGAFDGKNPFVRQTMK